MLFEDSLIAYIERQDDQKRNCRNRDSTIGIHSQGRSDSPGALPVAQVGGGRSGLGRSAWKSVFKGRVSPWLWQAVGHREEDPRDGLKAFSHGQLWGWQRSAETREAGGLG